MENNICCGVVCYKPNLNVLSCLIDSIKKQVIEIIIYFNDYDSYSMFYDQNDACCTLFVSDNIGIASAQNKLLKYAKEKKYDFILMSDQDSIYPEGYVKDLIPLFNKNISAVVPSWINFNEPSGKLEGQFVFENGKLKLRSIDLSDSNFFVSHAISSGMIISVEADNNINGMDDYLFIDWVDNDWCWRSSLHGYKILCNPRVSLFHYLGDEVVKVFGRSFVKRNNIRVYYIVRNIFYLLLYKKFPLSIKKYLALKLLHHVLFSLISSDHKFDCLKQILIGVSNGIQRK